MAQEDSKMTPLEQAAGLLAADLRELAPAGASVSVSTSADGGDEVVTGTAFIGTAAGIADASARIADGMKDRRWEAETRTMGTNTVTVSVSRSAQGGWMEVAD